MPSPRDPAIAGLASAVIMPGFCGAQVPDWLSRAVEGGLGGVCLFAPNVGADVAALTGALHGVRSDLLVASDEEGGEVTRLEAATGSSWPGHGALGRLDDLDSTRRIAAAIGRQARQAGVDLVLAPDADVTSNPDNPVIGLRSFGTDPELVARHTAAFVEGVQRATVAACAKHYPGHGDTRTDSHLGLPVIDVDVETLRRRDLPPFSAAISAGVRAVMTAHVVFPALDGSPATLSPTVLGLLRGELGFRGVIMSDALDMKAISAGVGRGRGAVLALAAGVDLVCIGNPNHPTPYDDEAAFHEVHDALVEAVAAGQLSRGRLEEAAQQVADLARWVAEAQSPRSQAAARESDEASEASEASDERSDEASEERSDAHEVAHTVASLVLDTHGTPRAGTPLHLLDLRGTPNVAAGPRPSGVVTALRARFTGLTVHHAAGEAETISTLAGILAGALAAADGESLVVLTGSPHRSPGMQRLLDAVVAARPDTVVVATGLPDERDRLGGHWVRTWGDSLPAGHAVATLLLD